MLMNRHFQHIVRAPGRRQDAIAKNATWFLAGAFVAAGLVTFAAKREIDKARTEAAEAKAIIQQIR